MLLKKPHFDVLVIGSPCVDMVFSGMPHWPISGQEMYVDSFAISVGAIFNTAATLTRLGMRVGLLCELGNDFFSHYILEEIDKAGICRDLVLVRDYPVRAVSVCIAHDGERGFISYADTQAGMVKHMLEILNSANHPDGVRDAQLLAQSLRQSLDAYEFDAAFLYAYPQMLPILEMLAYRKELPIFLDIGWFPDSLNRSRMASITQYGSYFMPNELEATRLTGAPTVEEAARQLSELVPTAIVKAGARGVVACSEGQLISCSALPIERVVDTTGAGDAFNGGFIYGILRGYSMADALRCGTICGSLSTTALSGTAAVPTSGELERIRRGLF